MHSLSSSMDAMVVQGERSNSQRFQGGYEHGESSNSNRDFYHGSQSNVTGGSGYVGTANRSFQQRNNGQNNYSRRFNNGNNNSKSYSGSYGNRNGNSYDGNGSSTYSGNGKQSQNGNFWNTRTNYWNGNTNYKSSVSPECQICSRRGHTAPNCYYRADNINTQTPGGFIVCQICGKRGHIALECYHRNNFSYQGAPPSSSLTAMTAQGHIGQQNASASSTTHDFSAADTWIVDTRATHHMTANMNAMNQATPYTGNEKIVVGNGESLAVKHMGIRPQG
ncbi:uncharacterized protein LOC126591940 [Malus sylvestris]|uniref:uncharacterized protein LOC126591940 n=1 Tax=Malus sylvestris TaxID=3752 RepID=UPI0021ABCBB8|nr:uncharacterized protein LOC126591940 [Malus sylvestris]